MLVNPSMSTREYNLKRSIGQIDIDITPDK
jgi:hypothetical protein